MRADPRLPRPRVGAFVSAALGESGIVRLRWCVMYGERSGREDRSGQTYPRHRPAGSLYGTPGGSDVAPEQPRAGWDPDATLVQPRAGWAPPDTSWDSPRPTWE